VPTNVVFLPLPGGGLAPARDRFGRELVAFHQPEHALSEQYRALLTSLTAQLPAGEPLALLFSCGPTEAGKTTVLLNLAITCAREGRSRVAVVDAGGSQGAVAGKLGQPQAPGLREVLANTVSLQRALAETGQPNLCVLPAGSGGDSLPPGDVLRPLLRQLREHFDWVLVDGPAWDGTPGMVAWCARPRSRRRRSRTCCPASRSAAAGCAATS
jgi:Mrp family chromosome partitioning ATPase